MLKCELIGHLGADAVVKNVNDSSFVTFRVADTYSVRITNGVREEKTRWVDVTMNRYDAILPYLLKGTLVYVRGNLDTRLYSSEKDRCMKCGLTIHAQEIQLLSAGKKTESSNQTMSSNDYKGF